MPTNALDDGPDRNGEPDAPRSRGLGAALEQRFGGELRKREGPADIAEEERVYHSMRARKGPFDTRARRPTLLAAAARTPGEVARNLLTVASYLGLLLVLLATKGQAFGRLPGVVQAAALLVLVVPAMGISSFVWTRIGEGARDVLRALVRFWPLTLAGGILVLGGLRLLLA